MKIGITARGLSERSGGAKQYIESLITSLLNIDSDNEYYIFYDSARHIGKYPSANEVHLDLPTKFLWDHIGVPYLSARYNIDLLFCPKNVIPFFVKCKTVVTILDLTHFKFPQEYRWADKYYMRLFMPSTARRADKIIAISENTKKDIVEAFGVNSDKVAAIPLAPDKKYALINDENLKEAFKNKYGLHVPFILFPGALSPRKNMVTLIKAFHKIKDSINHKIVFTAGKSWKDSAVYSLIEDLQLGDRIVVLGHIEDSGMPILYNLANLLVYPSIYEGFGLPAIEAMACGCPVVSSNSSSLPEVVEDAAITVNATDVEGLSRAILRMLTDDSLRDDMVRKGFLQAAKFSWNKTAQETLALFENVCRREKN